MVPLTLVFPFAELTGVVEVWVKLGGTARFESFPFTRANHFRDVFLTHNLVWLPCGDERGYFAWYERNITSQLRSDTVRKRGDVLH